MRTPLFLLLVAMPLALPAADSGGLSVQVEDAMKAGRTNEALMVASQAVATQPNNAAAWFLRGTLLARLGNHTNAISDFSRAAELDPKPRVFQDRGVEHFRVGNFDKSIADFDKVINLVPEQAPHHW